MMRACKFVAGLFALLYAAALFLFLVGTFGWFGSPRGPLAGIFLVPLGLPWSLMLDWAPDRALPWLAAGSPALNLILLLALCRASRK